MKELNELVELAKKANAAGQGTPEMVEFRVVANPDNILAIAEAFRSLSQRAEAAEAKLATKEQELAQYVECFEAEAARADRNHAKLAELEKQPPYGTLINTFLAKDPLAIAEAKRKGIPTVEVFTRPAPAVSLAELVPAGWKLVPVDPTEKMMREGFKELIESADPDLGVNLSAVYRRILASSPTPHD